MGNLQEDASFVDFRRIQTFRLSAVVLFGLFILSLLGDAEFAA